MTTLQTDIILLQSALNGVLFSNTAGFGLGDLMVSLSNQSASPTLVAGSNITLTPVGGTIVIASTGGGTTYTFSPPFINTSNTISLGTVSVANGGTGQSSTFTAGSVIFSNGTSLAQDNAKFFWNDTNFRLGIGNNTPVATLEVTAKNFTVSGSSVINSNIITVSSNAGIVPGQWVADSGGSFTNSNNSPAILETMYIVQSIAGNSITLNLNAASTVASNTFTFINPDWLQVDWGVPNRFFNMGVTDGYGRPAMNYSAPNGILKLGQAIADGDLYDIPSQGLVTYYTDLANDPMTNATWSLGYFFAQQILLLDSGASSSWFNVDPTSIFYANGAGAQIFSVQRANGNTVVGGTLALNGSTSGAVTLEAAATTTPYTATLPAAQGATGTVLTDSNGAGTLTWATPAVSSMQASVAPGYTLAPFKNLLAFTSSAQNTGTAALTTVPGLLATDTIIAVTQKTVGAAATQPILGWTAQIDGFLTIVYVADAGGASVVIVLVMR